MPWLHSANKIENNDGTVYEILPEPYWYLAPALTKYTPGDKKVKFYHFGMLLHNAHNSEGLVISLNDLLAGIQPSSHATVLRATAEQTLEIARQKEFLHLPSRLRSYFLNSTKEVADIRLRNDFRNQQRLLIKCYVIKNGCNIHHGNIRLYEKLLGRPEDLELAGKYWSEPITIKNPSDHENLEILVDGALFFPDWATFPQLDYTELIKWHMDQ